MQILANHLHPSILQLVDFQLDRTKARIVSELIDGQNLFDWLRSLDQGPRWQQIRQIFKEIVLAVQHIHNLGIVHRDLKLDNVMIYHDHQGNLSVKLIDFGLSTILFQGQQCLQRVGSVAFMSPEICGNHKHDHSTDVWSLGVILQALLTRRLPFVNVNIEMTISNIIHREPNFDQSCWEGVPE